MNVENGRYSVVNRKQAEPLADFVKRVRFEKRLSLKDVERNSHRQIAASYVSKIENGYANADGITPKKLEALAQGLGVSEKEIFDVARGKTSEDDPDYKNWKFASLFDDAQKLTPEQMREFEHLMEITRREVQRMLQEHAAKESAGSSGAPRRARKG